MCVKICIVFLGFSQLFEYICQRSSNYFSPSAKPKQSEVILFVENTNLATHGFGADVNLLCGNSQQVS